MSEFEETNEDGVIECPYCNCTYEDDIYGSGKEFYCDECDKSFHVEMETSVNFRCTPDCELNGLEHDFQQSEYTENFIACTVCGEYKPSYDMETARKKKKKILRDFSIQVSKIFTDVWVASSLIVVKNMYISEKDGMWELSYGADEDKTIIFQKATGEEVLTKLKELKIELEQGGKQ